jgi:prepilin-type N-terminal cleavage/methylation domain-containing protein
MLAPPRRLAFTMMELLVVIAIMAILASLILVGVRTIIGNANARKSDQIVQAVRQGIELAVAHKGSAISPTEHPLAGSRNDAGGGRFLFKRTDNSRLSASGVSLRGVPDVKHLNVGSQDLLDLPSDRYADQRVPILYGAARQDIGVLQSLRKVVTKYRMLPKPPPPKIDPTAVRQLDRDIYQKVVSPISGRDDVAYDDSSHYPDKDTLVPPPLQQTDPSYGLLGDSKLALDYLFGNSNIQAELAGLKALYNADPALPEDVNTYRTRIESRTINGVTEGLVYTNYGTTGQSDSKTMKNKYEPGYLPVGAVSGGITSIVDPAGANWVKYRLAGLAIYDAWQTEIFTVTDATGGYRVISAGVDGVLAINPGKNRNFDTTDLTIVNGRIVFTGDDTDGAKDNRQ